MIVGAVAPLIQGDVPPPIIEVFSADEVKTALIAVIVALLSFIAALVGLAKRWIDKRFSPIEEGVKAVQYQAENEHGPDGKNDNLRDQLDRMERKQDEGLARLDRKIDKNSGETRRDLQLIRESAIEDHSRIWDELSTKKDK